MEQVIQGLCNLGLRHPKSIQLTSAIMAGVVVLKSPYSLVSMICCANSLIDVSIYRQLSSLPQPAKCAAAVLASQPALCIRQSLSNSKEGHVLTHSVETLHHMFDKLGVIYSRLRRKHTGPVCFRRMGAHHKSNRRPPSDTRSF